jgi:hypothetical protein
MKPSLKHATGAQIGPYLGGSVGRSSAKVPNTNAFDGSTPGVGVTASHTGWAERGFIGFNVNKFFGLEVGYTNYARALYNARGAGGAFSQLQYNYKTWDAEGKAYFPLGYTGMNLYALGGVAHVDETINYTNGNIPLSGSIAQPAPGTTHANTTRPYYGLGINVTFYQHVTVNFEATQITNIRHYSTNYTASPYLNMASLGLAYNFC